MGRKNRKIHELKVKLRELKQMNEELKIYSEVLKECLIKERQKFILQKIEENTI